MDQNRIDALGKAIREAADANGTGPMTHPTPADLNTLAGDVIDGANGHSDTAAVSVSAGWLRNIVGAKLKSAAAALAAKDAELARERVFLESTRELMKREVARAESAESSLAQANERLATLRNEVLEEAAKVVAKLDYQRNSFNDWHPPSKDDCVKAIRALKTALAGKE